MKSVFALLVAFTVLTATAEARVGGEVGNGGDVIQCTDSTSGKTELFALDNLLAPPSNPIVNFDVLNRVFETVRVRHPSLSSDLYYFIQELKSEKLTGTNVWSPVHFGLTNIDDEMTVEKLPPTCGAGTAVGTKQWQQAIVQTAVGSKRYYKYEADLLTELEKNPLQYSQLLIHEWLWRYADDALQVRLANQFLHEQTTGTLSAYEFTTILNGIGLHIPAIDPNSAYHIKTEVGENGKLRDLRFEHQTAHKNQPVFVQFTNRSSIAFEIRMDAGDGRLDQAPQMLNPGAVLEKMIPIPAVLFLYDRNGGWPAVQSLEIN